MKTLQKTAISTAAVALLAGLSTVAFAADEPAAAPEVSPITANVTVASSYIYRGITQSNNKPAIQGGFDYAHESGFYVGNWNSSISWISDSYNNALNTNGPKNSAPSTSAPIEMDFYAGFKKEFIGEGFASDFGVLQYYYPTTGLGGVQTKAWVAANPSMRQTSGVNPSTTELYAAQNFTFGPVTGFGKFSYAVSNLFGIQNSAGSFYPDLTANYDTGMYGITVNAHVGYQYVPNNVVSTTAQVTGAGNPPNQAGTWNASYADWKLGLTKDFGGGLSGSAYYTGTSAQKVGTTYVYATPNGGNAGRANAVVALTKTF